MTSKRIRGIGRIQSSIIDSEHSNPDLDLIRAVLIANHPHFSTRYEVLDYMTVFREMLGNENIMAAALRGCKVSFEGEVKDRTTASGLPELKLTALKIID